MLGVTLFLLTTMFVFSLLPGYLSPHMGGIGGDEQAQADRVARTLVANLSTQFGNATLRSDDLDALLGRDQDALRERYGLPPTATISISVRTVPDGRLARDGGDPLTNEENRTTGPAARSSRLVEVASSDCRPTCRLVVEVW